MKTDSNQPQLAVCIDNSAYPDDLKVRTIYQVLPDDSATRSNYIRVIDETGEDYLYPAEYFGFVDVPPEAARALMVDVESPPLSDDELVLSAEEVFLDLDRRTSRRLA